MYVGCCYVLDSNLTIDGEEKATVTREKSTNVNFWRSHRIEVKSIILIVLTFNPTSNVLSKAAKSLVVSAQYALRRKNQLITSC